MLKVEALVVLEAKVIKLVEKDDNEFAEQVVELIKRFDNIPESVFETCQNFNDIRVVIEHYKAPSVKRSAPKTNTYYELIVPVADATEKAIGVVTGENNKHGSNRREYIQWIPMSQIIKENEKFYIPTWIISKNVMWNVVNRNSKMVK